MHDQENECNFMHISQLNLTMKKDDFGISYIDFGVFTITRGNTEDMICHSPDWLKGIPIMMLNREISALKESPNCDPDPPVISSANVYSYMYCILSVPSVVYAVIMLN